MRAGRSWAAGSLDGHGWEGVLLVLPFVAIGIALAAAASRGLNAEGLGADLATALGANRRLTRDLVVVGHADGRLGPAVVGVVWFVGMMVPHAARWFTGPDQRWVLAYCCLLGPILMLAADLVGRVVVTPDEIPAGLVTAFVDAPCSSRLRVGRGHRAMSAPTRTPTPQPALPAELPRVVVVRRAGLGRRACAACARHARVDPHRARLGRSCVGPRRGPGLRTADVIRALVAPADPVQEMVVRQWRLPRVLLALMFGAALGIAGAVMQSLTRNPLGDPDVIGFDSGAYTAAILTIVAVGSTAWVVPARSSADCSPHSWCTCWPTGGASRGSG